MTFSDKFRVKPGHKLALSAIDPAYKEHHRNKQDAQAEIDHNARRLVELQYLLYAEGQRGLLICLQAMDTGGKDGTIRHVLSYMNPQGCRVQAFKVPTHEEAAHDFLWRAHKVTPRRGEVVIFNRSHYEDVLVARVHKLVSESLWSKRYDAINAFEKLLADNNTHVLKFFLHISKDEQLKRFKKRLEDPARHWKISEADYAERHYWEEYQKAYEDALTRCSTEQAPWYVIPADHKWFRNLAISRIVVEYLEGLDMRFPAPTVNIANIKKEYHEAQNEER
ncbi:MAG: polyphosphate kinase 2 family protein [Gammaproteobacteria bacterium]|jgi:PPK2 family polyphosphate:nucleotide phosphotransferase